MSTASKRLIDHYCRDGNDAAFDQFYRDTAGPLWSYLVARGCAQEDAYDIVAEAFSRFLPVVCRDPSFPKALLYRIATNLQIDSVRRQRPSIDIQESPLAAQQTNPDTPIYLQQLLDTLPDFEQNLLLMRYRIGMTYREIAKVLDRPEGTLRREGANALRRLQSIWGQENSG